MAQMNWVYLDTVGGRHKVGLYHGDRSGHVMIHCNLKVVQVDFSVKDSKMYSFFIEDELCEVILDKKDGVFGYEFRVNKKADTPRNRDRRVQEGQTRKYMFILASGIVLLLAAVFFGLRWYGQTQESKRIASTSIVSKYSTANMKRLSTEGKRTVARLHLVHSVNQREQKISYTLLALDTLMEQGDFSVATVDPIILPNGFPFSEGDEFEAIYLPADPQVHRVDFFQPSRSTTTRYIQMASQIEQKIHPYESPEKCACRVLTVAEQVGWPNLAHFIFQEKSPEDDARFNSDTYARLMQDPDLLKSIRERCGGR